MERQGRCRQMQQARRRVSVSKTMLEGSDFATRPEAERHLLIRSLVVAPENCIDPISIA
jgi:hypothetical protein